MLSIARNLPTFAQLVEAEARAGTDQSRNNESPSLRGGAEGLLFISGDDPSTLPTSYGVLNVECSGFSSADRVFDIGWASVVDGLIVEEWRGLIDWANVLGNDDGYWTSMRNLLKIMQDNGRDFPYSDELFASSGITPDEAARTLYRERLCPALTDDRWILGFGLWSFAGRKVEHLLGQVGVNIAWEPARLIDVGMIEKSITAEIPPEFSRNPGITEEQPFEWQARVARTRSKGKWNLDQHVRAAYSIFRAAEPLPNYSDCPLLDCWMIHILYERWRQELQQQWASQNRGRSPAAS